ncbi:protein MLN51 homolog [Daucus carota subsp. sativus]|uniref:protein MLN51 homolog n=1 Tax=Daucus carota subsp. sativus TaxID=79200 RepID=UPI0007EF77DE|nr:PREDICTED: protein CASC3-like isoform X2 [Daucus carota subsp. sativus]
MASVEKQELEYESDPEESRLSLTMMRRREASDDEDEEKDLVDGSGMPVRRVDSRVSNCEYDDEGAPAEYNDEEFEVQGEELDGEIEGEYVEERVSVSDVTVVALGLDEVPGINRVEEGEKENDGGVYFEGYDQFGDNVVNERVEGEKKENEPFAVPTAGAFYMHDDRFRESRGGGRGRHRRTFGGRSLWESKDDRRWGHDKFEEVTMRARNYDEGRRGSRGRSRGRGRGRGEERVFSRVSRTRAFHNKNQNNEPNNNDNTMNNHNNALDNQRNAVNYQKSTPKGERGRGPRSYQPTWKKHESPAENKQRKKSPERSSHVNAGRTSGHKPSADNDSVPVTRHVFSSLNSASPPFYPSASSNVETSFGQKIDEQSAPPRQNQQSSVGDGSFIMSQSNTMQGKNVADLVGMNKLYIDDSRLYSTKSLTNSQLQDSGSSLINPSHSLQSRVQGSNQAHMRQISYQPNATHNQVKGVSTSFSLSNVQQIPVQTRGQIAPQASSQQFEPHPSGGIQTSYSIEPEEIDSVLESGKSRTALVEKGKGGIKEHVRGSFPYDGVQIMGASGNFSCGPGDQNFSATPTFLPVMQFGGQHPGRMGVPAVGMAFPGYVGNPESGKSEMTWLPVLAGAAGAMGASYCNPYLSVDSAYHTRPSGQTLPIAAGLRESDVIKPGNGLKPSQRPEPANDEFGQRQNKSRRYTEMKFDQ